jgi:hypothetical protein
MDLENIGSLNLDKGIIRDGHSLFAWDAIQDCDVSSCPVSKKCTYLKRGKCAVQVAYLKRLCNDVCKTYKYMDDLQYFKIGTQIIPLYSHLFRLKLLELSLKEIVYVNPKGVKFIHPVYKEIRQTLSTIHLMWKDLGVTPEIPEMPPLNGKPTLKGRNYIYGDPTYAEKLANMDNNIDMRGIVR